MYLTIEINEKLVFKLAQEHNVVSKLHLYYPEKYWHLCIAIK